MDHLKLNIGSFEENHNIFEFFQTEAYPAIGY
jgi:hypothetical protein